MSKKAIILSGGGAKGAWGVGVVKALMEQGRTYDYAIGTSTGSLMAPFILAGEIQRLEEGYTSVNQDNIFNKNPFNDDGGIKSLFVIGRLIRGRKTLGESKNLRKKIDELVKDDLFNKIRAEKKLLGATVVNFNRGISQVKTTDVYTDDEMRDWIWASANNPLFMSNFDFTDRDGSRNTYADGGITNFANLEYLLLNRPKGLTEIDVIFHNTREVITDGYNMDNKILQRLFRVMDMFSAEVFKNDLTNGIMTTRLLENDVKLTIYYMRDHDITTITGISRNTLLFDQQKMRMGVIRGYEYLKRGEIDMDSCTIVCDSGRIVVDSNTP